MKSDEPETDRIIIKKFEDELTAFIIDEAANRGHLLCYAHLGQHSEASLDFFWACKPVNYGLPEVQDLVHELKSIGYNPRLLKRLPAKRGA